MKDEFITRIGVWGQRHYNYLKKHNTTVIDVMRMNETLEQYMRDIDRDAEEMFSQLVKHLAESEGVTEQLKAENQMLWVQSMNNITNRAKERDIIIKTKTTKSNASFFKKALLFYMLFTRRCYITR